MAIKKPWENPSQGGDPSAAEMTGPIMTTRMPKAPTPPKSIQNLTIEPLETNRNAEIGRRAAAAYGISQYAAARNRDKNFFGHYEVTKANVVKNAPLGLNQTKKDNFIEPMANVRKVQGSKRAY